MKMKILFLALAGGLVLTSCNKTYECRDQTGTVTGEVNAPSQSKANSLCQSHNPNPITATKK